MPTSMEVPDIETVHVETPSTLNPLGIKGAGEAGVIPVPALMAAAVEDALRPFGVHVTDYAFERQRHPGSGSGLKGSRERSHRRGAGGRMTMRLCRGRSSESLVMNGKTRIFPFRLA